MRKNDENIRESNDNDEIIRASINHNIKKLMTERDVTQKELAAYINISTTKFCRALSLGQDEKDMRGGKTKFNIYELGKIVEFFNITFDQLITGISNENKNEHNKTGLDNNSINWLKYIGEEKEYLLEIINLVLGNREIAESMFGAIYLYIVSDIPQTYFKKEGTVNERQARAIIDDELLLRYAIVGSFEEILKLIKKEYKRYPNNYFQRVKEEKIADMCKTLGKNLQDIKNKQFVIDEEYEEDMKEFYREADENK